MTILDLTRLTETELRQAVRDHPPLPDAPLPERRAREQERLALLREQMRRERRAKEQKRSRDRDQARESGEPYIDIEWHDTLGALGPHAGQVLQVELVDGQVGRIRPCAVVFINQPGRAYDYEVTVDIDFDAPGGPQPYTRELGIWRRPGGLHVSERQLHKEGTGELRRMAVALASRSDDDGAPIGIAESSISRLMGEDASVPDSDRAIGLVVEVVTQVGRPSRELIAQRLQREGLAHSDSTVKKLLRRARSRGLIPAGQVGRPNTKGGE